MPPGTRPHNGTSLKHVLLASSNQCCVRWGVQVLGSVVFTPFKLYELGPTNHSVLDDGWCFHSCCFLQKRKALSSAIMSCACSFCWQICQNSSHEVENLLTKTSPIMNAPAKTCALPPILLKPPQHLPIHHGHLASQKVNSGSPIPTGLIWFDVHRMVDWIPSASNVLVDYDPFSLDRFGSGSFWIVPFICILAYQDPLLCSSCNLVTKHLMCSHKNQAIKEHASENHWWNLQISNPDS